jgi:hypothetical protein
MWRSRLTFMAAAAGGCGKGDIAFCDRIGAAGFFTGRGDFSAFASLTAESPGTRRGQTSTVKPSLAVLGCAEQWRVMRQKDIGLFGGLAVWLG